MFAPSLHQTTHRPESEADNLHLDVLAVIDWQSASSEDVEVSDKLTLQPRVFLHSRGLTQICCSSISQQQKAARSEALF